MNWIQRLFRRNALEKEFDRELKFHVEELKQENIAKGMPEAEAYRRAMLEFGGREQCKEELRDAYGFGLLETATRNFKFALRLMRKSPGFSAAIILTLTLGIGANSAVFSAIDAILLKPLPFPEGDQLMLIQQRNTQAETPNSFVAPIRLEEWNRMNSTFQCMTGYFIENASEISGPLPERMTKAFVAPRFLQVLGIQPAFGRDFTPQEHKFGGPEAILISDRLWRNRFNSNPGVIGQKLSFGKQPATIIGVMPASFRFQDRNVDVWSPVPTDAPYAQVRKATWYTTVGRLKPGVTVAQARADLAVVQGRLAAAYPATDAQISVVIEPLKETTVAGSKRSLWILFGAVTVLLLIACTNIAGLLLSRTTERTHEIAVRASLGASLRSLMAQLLTEVFVLVLIGTVAGLGVAAAAAKMFRVMAHDLPRVDEVGLDWRIVVYSLVCAIGVTLLCGTLPAWRAIRSGLSGSLAHGGRTQVSGRHPMQWMLVAVQVTFAVTLLLGAGLLLRSFQEMARVSPGFDSSHVLTFQVSGSWAETVNPKGMRERIQRTVERLQAVPGVEIAATSASLPGVPNKFPTELKILEGEVDPERKLIADSRFVSPAYFATMRVPVLAGDTCRESNNRESENKELMVNRSFVNTVFGGREAIGHHVQFTAQAGFTGEIRGIVADTREQGINAPAVPTVYWCLSDPNPTPNYLVRTHGDPLAMVDTLRRVVAEVEPGRAVFNISSLNEQLSDAFAEDRMRTILLTFFAVTAVSLACIGLYGTLSYIVNTRRKEVGLRLALGARREQIARNFLMQGFRVCVAGCIAGLILSAASGRLLQGMLFGVSAGDPRTVVAVLVLVIGVSGLAALLPALRASRTDPMNVLREG
jgi:putative ABC transport system permease protein